MSVTSEQIIEALRPVEDPELHRSIVDLGMVRRAEPRPDGTASILVALTVAGCPLRNEIQNRVTGAVGALPGVTGVDLEFTVMTDQDREDLRNRLRPGPGGHRTPATTTVAPQRRATPRASRCRSTSPARGPARCSSRRARAASASRRSPPTWPWRSRPGATPSASSTPTSTASRSPGCSAPTPSRSRSTRCCCRRSRGACGASRSATSSPRARRSSGGARCCTRRSSSSSPTCTGTTPTSSSSTCHPAPATSPSRCRSTCPGARCTWSPRRRRRRRRSPACRRRWPPRSTSRCAA